MEKGKFGQFESEPFMGGNLGPGWVQYRKTLANESM